MSQTPAVIIGNVTADPELTFTNSGIGRLGFSVACNYSYTDANGDKQEKVSYFNVVAWRYLAEDTAAVLEKGVGVIVSGRLEQRSWEDKEGNKRSTVELVADSIGIQTRSIESFERKRRNESENGAPAPAKKATRTAPRVPAGVGAEEEPF
jgi:single-strand DNA-binding protein